MITDWRSYHGNWESDVFDQAECQKFIPSRFGHSRHVTPNFFVPPIVVAGWIRIAEDREGLTGNNSAFDGIHLHVGHLGNDRNYVASLVRRDGHSVISREYGWRGYDDIDREPNGPEFLLHRVYVFQVLWKIDEIWAKVSDWGVTREFGGLIPRLANTGPSAGTHRPLIPAGAIGIRGDNLILQAGLAVREI